MTEKDKKIKELEYMIERYKNVVKDLAYVNIQLQKQLNLTDVNQQREQFTDLLIWYKYNVGRDNIKNCKELAEEYINL